MVMMGADRYPPHSRSCLDISVGSLVSASLLGVLSGLGLSGVLRLRLHRSAVSVDELAFRWRRPVSSQLGLYSDLYTRVWG